MGLLLSGDGVGREHAILCYKSPSGVKQHQKQGPARQGPRRTFMLVLLASSWEEAAPTGEFPTCPPVLHRPRRYAVRELGVGSK